MDYIVATLDSKTGQQREVDSFVDKLKFDDRLFIFECDNVEMEQSPLRTVPTHQPNIFTITLNEFPFKTFLQFVRHYLEDCDILDHSDYHYNLCMLNRRPAAIRVYLMEQAKQWGDKFIGSMYNFEREENNNPPIDNISYENGIVTVKSKYHLNPEQAEMGLTYELQYHSDYDLSLDYNIPEIPLTESSTILTSDSFKKKYNIEFPHCVLPPDEWFQSKCDLFHEGDQFFSEKLTKCFYYKKPFLNIGMRQRLREFGFENYFNVDSDYDSVHDLARDICTKDALDDYNFDEKIEHNYNVMLDLFNKYGNFAEFITKLEQVGSVTDPGPEIKEHYPNHKPGQLMDEHLKLIEEINVS